MEKLGSKVTVRQRPATSTISRKTAPKVRLGIPCGAEMEKARSDRQPRLTSRESPPLSNAAPSFLWALLKQKVETGTAILEPETKKSQRWDLNPQPQHYECCALPIELRWLITAISELRSAGRADGSARKVPNTQIYRLPAVPTRRSRAPDPERASTGCRLDPRHDLLRLLDDHLRWLSSVQLEFGDDNIRDRPNFQGLVDPFLELAL